MKYLNKVAFAFVLAAVLIYFAYTVFSAAVIFPFVWGPTESDPSAGSLDPGSALFMMFFNLAASFALVIIKIFLIVGFSLAFLLLSLSVFRLFRHLKKPQKGSYLGVTVRAFHSNRVFHDDLCL